MLIQMTLVILLQTMPKPRSERLMLITSISGGNLLVQITDLSQGITRQIRMTDDIAGKSYTSLRSLVTITAADTTISHKGSPPASHDVKYKVTKLLNAGRSKIGRY